MSGTDGEPSVMISHVPARPPSLFGGVWLLSFADLISILVTFFIMLYSMSDVQPAAWNALRDGLARGLGRPESQIAQPMSLTHAPASEAVGVNLDYLAVLLGERLAADVAETEAAILRRDDRIVIALAEPDLFMPDQAAMSGGAARRLERIAEVLRHVRNRIEVATVSHDLPLGDAERAWEMSIGRAHFAAQALRRAGYSRDVVALATVDAAHPADGIDRIEIHVLGVTP